MDAVQNVGILSVYSDANTSTHTRGAKRRRGATIARNLKKMGF